MPQLTLASTSPATTPADAVVVGIGKGADGPVLTGPAQVLAHAIGGTVVIDALTALGATGAAEEVTVVPTLGSVVPAAFCAVGLGEATADGTWSAAVLRRAAGAAVRHLAGRSSVSVALPTDGGALLAAAAEGAGLGAYAFDTFRKFSTEGRKAPVATVVLLDDLAEVGDDDAAQAAVRRADVLTKAVSLARDLVNTPPGDLGPAAFVAAATAAVEGTGLTVEVLDETQLREQGYGGITGVGQGSTTPPRLMRISYTAPAADGTAARTVALVGKGITFDSGGLSLKPPASMETMKSDMAGAASVVATLVAVAALQPGVSVVGWTPLAENMPSGSAIRPSDVLKMYGGRTVEVLNTDAEGRLVLADAIVRACQENPDYLVDVATLTGAQMVALGARVAGVMGDEQVRDALVAAGETAGEPMWPMPLPAELRAGLDSEIADIKNVADRFGGMLTAGLFLKEFVAEGVAWSHIDIAGPSYNEGKPYGFTPVGGTGVPVRTLVTWLEQLA